MPKPIHKITRQIKCTTITYKEVIEGEDGKVSLVDGKLRVAGVYDTKAAALEHLQKQLGKNRTFFVQSCEVDPLPIKYEMPMDEFVEHATVSTSKCDIFDDDDCAE